LKTIRILLIGLVGVAMTSVAAAQVVDTGKLFFGGGVSSNETSSSDNATGWQVFGGYGFGEVTRNIFIDAEVGYMDSGNMKQAGRADFKANGLWAAGVGRLLLTPSIELLGRLGMDFGDDDGVLAGIGVGFILGQRFKLRFEFVQRDNVDSIQFNLVFQP
ncbi:MAG: outer membrane beta-barrel protein, partial [Bryobacteraceae bacterium]